jgi:hypothetical protein
MLDVILVSATMKILRDDPVNGVAVRCEVPVRIRNTPYENTKTRIIVNTKLRNTNYSKYEIVFL